jgi:hypothetical protein
LPDPYAEYPRTPNAAYSLVASLPATPDLDDQHRLRRQIDNSRIVVDKGK